MCIIQRNILDARRWLSLFLVCCFVLCGLGGINQRAQAIVGVDDALIGIMIAGLAAVGITFVSTGAYDSLTDYVGSLLDEYAGSLGTTGRGLFTGVQTGANGIGQILINNRMVRLISAFATWLKVKFGLTNNSSETVVDPSAVNGITLYSVPATFGYYYANIAWTYYTVAVSGSAKLYEIAYTSQGRNMYEICAVGNGPFSVMVTRYRSDDNVPISSVTKEGVLNNQSYFAELYGYNIRFIDFATNQDVKYSDITFAESKTLLDGNVADTGDQIDIVVGLVNLPTDDPAYNDGDGAIIDVAAPWGMTYPEIVNKWLPKEWAPGQAGNPSMTYDAAPAIDEQVQTGPVTEQVSSDPGDYTVPGLQSVFPFCIPFDIYNLLSALAADPVAPSFTWRFYVPRVCDETFTVDLSPFDTVAQIVRTVELLAYIVGLAMVTRERFLRG